MYTQEVTVVGAQWQTNCYFLTSAGETLIIDPGDDAKVLIGELQHLNPVGIVCTHAHNDHIGGVLELRDALKIPIMIHKDDVPMASDPHLSGFDEEIGRQDYAIPRWDRKLSDGDQITFGEESLTVIHVPGHTPGSICLLNEPNKQLYTGDTLFAGAVGRTDFLQGNSQEMHRSLMRLGKLSPNIAIFPGHGPSSTLGIEFQRNPLLGH